MTVTVDDAVGLPIVSVHLDLGMPGFPGLRELHAAPWGGPGSPFVVLSAADPGVRFVVAAPGVFFPDYDPAIPHEVLVDLELGRDGAPALIWVILTLGRSPAETTANLLGPLVVNPVNGRARQVVLSGSGWMPDTPLTGRAA